MNPLKKFEEWYERRHPIAKGILIVLPIILFLYSFGLVFLGIAEAGTDFVELGLVPFTIIGYVILFIVVSIHKKLNKNVLGGLGALLFFPFLFWGICQIWIIDVIFRYWQISVLLLTSVGATFIVWKFWGKRKWELRKRKKALARELEDQLKGLDEQLSLGHITQEEYEQKKKGGLGFFKSF